MPDVLEMRALRLGKKKYFGSSGRLKRIYQRQIYIKFNLDGMLFFYKLFSGKSKALLFFLSDF